MNKGLVFLLLIVFIWGGLLSLFPRSAQAATNNFDVIYVDRGGRLLPASQVLGLTTKKNMKTNKKVGTKIIVKQKTKQSKKVNKIRPFIAPKVNR